MFRFICFLLGKPYESCKSCETLRQQLAIANEEKRELTTTLINLLNPQVFDRPVVELQPMRPKLTLWAKRKAALEERDRNEARTKIESKNIGRPDNSIEKLEQELGVDENAS